jgi:hypothetical protein|tara:strand:+ start:439 stop:642 length:204 start_codon:yes stop_codon:yes gene_type:complete
MPAGYIGRLLRAVLSDDLVDNLGAQGAAGETDPQEENGARSQSCTSLPEASEFSSARPNRINTESSD